MNSGTMYSAKKDPATVNSTTTNFATIVSAAMDPATMDTAKIHTEK